MNHILPKAISLSERVKNLQRICPALEADIFNQDIPFLRCEEGKPWLQDKRNVLGRRGRDELKTKVGEVREALGGRTACKGHLEAQRCCRQARF